MIYYVNDLGLEINQTINMHKYSRHIIQQIMERTRIALLSVKVKRGYKLLL